MVVMLRPASRDGCARSTKSSLSMSAASWMVGARRRRQRAWVLRTSSYQLHWLFCVWVGTFEGETGLRAMPERALADLSLIELQGALATTSAKLPFTSHLRTDPPLCLRAYSSADDAYGLSGYHDANAPQREQLGMRGALRFCGGSSRVLAEHTAQNKVM